MSRQLFIGLWTEGSTDTRFLESIVSRTFEEVAFDCTMDIEVGVHSIDLTRDEVEGKGFVDGVLAASAKGMRAFGMTVLCCHTDADARDDSKAMSTKIGPAQQSLAIQDERFCCKELTALIPVRMMEAWMLADTVLLKEEVGTELSDSELGLTRHPESIANPKKLIEDVISTARQRHTKRRRRDLTINQLYQPIGMKMKLERLETLPSYCRFKEAVRASFIRLNLMR